MKDFLLTTPIAKKLYDEAVKDLPIIDYHNHLDVQAILQDKKYEDIYELWIKTDPYKHRIMRICGVDEDYITGTKPAYEKFLKWCEIFPSIVGTPLFDWSIMELNYIFSIDKIPNTQNAEEIWNKTKEMLKKDEFSTKGILSKFKLEYSAPCVSILDDISNFSKIPYLSFSIRCDDILNADKEFLLKLQNITQTKIESLQDLERAIDKRLQYLALNGGKFTDHALDDGFVYVQENKRNEKILKSILKGKTINSEDKISIQSCIFRFLAKCYVKYNYAMQLHIGAKRETSTRLRNMAGKAGGFAGIGNSVQIKYLTTFLDDIEKSEGKLPKTLLFTLNPTDHAMLSVLSGSYAKSGEEAVVSEGPAWWWCDHLQGMKEMLENNSVYGVLSTFFGMTTDSRSILSFVRHDYFRRVLCMWIGEKVEKGEFINDYNLFKDVVIKMCYKNAHKFISKEEGGNENAF